jgi:hypothetical protein
MEREQIDTVVEPKSDRATEEEEIQEQIPIGFPHQV